MAAIATPSSLGSYGRNIFYLNILVSNGFLICTPSQRESNYFRCTYEFVASIVGTTSMLTAPLKPRKYGHVTEHFSILKSAPGMRPWIRSPRRKINICQTSIGLLLPAHSGNRCIHLRYYPSLDLALVAQPSFLPGARRSAHGDDLRAMLSSSTPVC